MEMGSFFSTRVYCLEILKETVGRGSYLSVERINNVTLDIGQRDTPGHWLVITDCTTVTVGNSKIGSHLNQT